MPGQAEQVASTGISLSHFVTRIIGFFIGPSLSSVKPFLPSFDKCKYAFQSAAKSVFSVATLTGLPNCLPGQALKSLGGGDDMPNLTSSKNRSSCLFLLTNLQFVHARTE